MTSCFMLIPSYSYWYEYYSYGTPPAHSIFPTRQRNEDSPSFLSGPFGLCYSFGLPATSFGDGTSPNTDENSKRK